MIMTEEKTDMVNHPQHYKKFQMEVIDMMERIWGPEAVIAHCEMCAFKYKMRAGEKDPSKTQEDLNKATWYLNKASELKRKK